MSHYTVMVVGPKDDEELAVALAPFDENIEVEEYRRYIDGQPEEFYLVRSLRRQIAENKITGPESEAIKALLACSDPCSWRDVSMLTKVLYGKDDYSIIHIDEEGQPYELSTYNPDSKWDWYQVGGRWAGYLHVKPGTEKPLEFSWTWDNVPEEDRPGPGRSDCARRGDIDIEGWTAELRAAALEKWSESEELSQEVFVNNYVRDRMTTYALLTKEGEWMEPGRMGWWGMSSATDKSQQEFTTLAYNYFMTLDPDDMVWIVDCHI